MPDAKRRDELTQFACDLQAMRNRAINLRLDATRQRLDSAIQGLGFEISGDPDSCGSYELPQTVPKRQLVLAGSGREFHCQEAMPCAGCGSTESEMRTYGGKWEDADTHCAKCGKLIRRAWFQ